MVMEHNDQEELGKCEYCGTHKTARRLVVALDGTMNQFGAKVTNSNVVEIYHRIEKNDQQLTYYNSGIGTYSNPSRKFSWKLMKTHLDSLVDLAIAWWDLYMPEMRNKFRSPMSSMQPQGTRSQAGGETSIASRFKETFSRPNVRVHFIGAWDTVSSVGLLPSKALPKTRTADHVCVARHALALDERRVKFAPEFLQTTRLDNINTTAVNAVPPTCVTSTETSWMANEAQDEGLTFNDSNVDWEMSKIQEQKPRESLRWWWWLAEAIPFLRRQEDCPKPHQWIIPHMGAHRIIYPGQKIHLSVALNRKYLPKAQFHAYSSTAHSPAWSTILGKDLDANEGDTQDASKYGWMDDLGDILELDLFDITAIPELVKKLSQPQDSKVALDHLFVLAHDVHRTRAIVEADRSIGRSLWRIAHVNRDAPDLLRSVLRLVERLVTDDAGLQALWDSSLVLLLSDHVGNSVQEDSNPSETLRLLRLYSSLYWHAHTVAEYTVYPYTELILSKTLHTEWAAIAVSAYATLVRRCEWKTADVIEQLVSLFVDSTLPYETSAIAAQALYENVTLFRMQPDSDPKVVQDVIFQSDPEKQIKASSFADTWSAHIEQMGQRAFRPAFLRWVEEESRRQWTYRSFLLLCLVEVAKDCGDRFAECLPSEFVQCVVKFTSNDADGYFGYELVELLNYKDAVRAYHSGQMNHEEESEGFSEEP
ncbi:hypothetical protein IEO21_06687 [Rhodonia placenta]|uniref:T6SS Phospholipase effector Tle1-like catalytic domain-containing protein n=1 Tax=Rhodonia placenta TaxID=104341 RepID=A0A8H7U0H7_9APHY|nr:hypothetical protein IEO21_06687 [Postia placenta]